MELYSQPMASMTSTFSGPHSSKATYSAEPCALGFVGGQVGAVRHKPESDCPPRHVLSGLERLCAVDEAHGPSHHPQPVDEGLGGDFLEGFQRFGGDFLARWSLGYSCGCGECVSGFSPTLTLPRWGRELTSGGETDHDGAQARITAIARSLALGPEARGDMIGIFIPASPV